MGDGAENKQPKLFKITVMGHLDDSWDDWFNGLSITHESQGTTVLSGPILDQTALHGVLEKIRALNLTLISVQQVDRD